MIPNPAAHTNFLAIHTMHTHTVMLTSLVTISAQEPSQQQNGTTNTIPTTTTSAPTGPAVYPELHYEAPVQEPKKGKGR